VVGWAGRSGEIDSNNITGRRAQRLFGGDGKHTENLYYNNISSSAVAGGRELNNVRVCVVIIRLYCIAAARIPSVHGFLLLNDRGIRRPKITPVGCVFLVCVCVLYRYYTMMNVGIGGERYYVLSGGEEEYNKTIVLLERIQQLCTSMSVWLVVTMTCVYTCSPRRPTTIARTL